MPVVAVCLLQIDRRHPPRLAYRVLAAGERHIGKVRRPRVGTQVAHQYFAAPQCAVVAVARAVGSNADDVLGKVMLCHDAGNVGVVVLHSDARQGLAQCVARCEIVGVHVVGYDCRGNVEQMAVVCNGVLVGGKRFEVFEVANVVAEQCLSFVQQAEGIFLVGTAREYGVRR